MITRKEYLAGTATHRQYYGQFVDAGMLKALAIRLPVDMLKAAYEHDPHFNAIALHRWDMLAHLIPYTTEAEVRKASNGGGYSKSDAVCILKEAALQLVELNNQKA